MARTDKKYYTGSKQIPGVFQKIINNIPAATDYYELFAGSGTIGSILSVRSLDVNFHFNDLDPTVISKKYYPSGGTVTNLPALDILQQIMSLPAATDFFIFCDPPYLHSTRPNSTHLYDIEMSDSDHVQLLNTLLQLKCNCMIIHPECELYNSRLSNWTRVQIKIRYHKKTSVEYLYMNYPKPSKLMCSDFVGSDCWDRQRIKRKSDRLINKILALPDHEKQYIITNFKKSIL